MLSNLTDSINDQQDSEHSLRLEELKIIGYPTLSFSSFFYNHSSNDEALSLSESSKKCLTALGLNLLRFGLTFRWELSLWAKNIRNDLIPF